MSHARTVWEEGRETGLEVIALGLAVSLTVVWIDLAVAGRVGLLFDLSFVLLCVGLALAVRPSDFFTAGVLPPLLMLVVFMLLGIADPDVIAHPEDGAVQAIVSGLSQHSEALVAGYVLSLAVLLVRRRVDRRAVPRLQRVS